jgi:FkbM family methyltransferase
VINFFKKIYYEKYSQKSYSASPVDLVINRIFRGKKKGYYIDLGCNHPIKYSNTYLLHQRGWQGINIDADKESIIQFNRFRKNDVNKNISVSSKIGFKKFYIYHFRSALNTFERNLVKKRKAKPIKIEMVETDTLNNIIENSKFKKKKFDLLSIDIENHEYQALKNFNFKKYKIKIIIIELINMNFKKIQTENQTLSFLLKSKIYKLLTKNNYKLINWVGSDLIFYRI